MIKIGINGFSRIGRMVLRACIENKLQVLVVNDPFLTTENFAYLFKFDSTHGQFIGDVSVDSNTSITINGGKIDVYRERDPSKIPWKKYGVEYVIDATGVFTDNEKASLHLDAGAKCVVVASPSKDLPMFVYGVNHQDYKSYMTIISSACSTTNCLAVLAKVVHENYTIVEGLMTTVHATSPTQKVLDSPGHAGGNKREGRGALQNIIPGCTGAAKCIGHILPDLDGRLTGMAMRVPVASVSAVDLTVRLARPAAYEEIKKRIKQASEGSMRGILSWTDEDVVSSDLIGNQNSCIFDVKAGVPLNNRFVKLIAWYDNEVAYCHRIVDLIKYIDARP
ncbi:Glyceraldehyde 3 phosphate dehydrogenase 2 [Carabus blaptoides fortunei]